MGVTGHSLSKSIAALFGGRHNCYRCQVYLARERFIRFVWPGRGLSGLSGQVEVYHVYLADKCLSGQEEVYHVYLAR